MSLTRSQQEAVAARGNVLVVAGAGTGKTRTLVERCLDCLVSGRPRVSIEELLVVTFTEAAAAEMRQRIRARIEEERARDPHDLHWEEQSALFETAHIGTIHSFCFELVRAHFYELELDPQLSILPEEETRLLAEETLDPLLRAHYANPSEASEAVRKLIQAQTRGSDQPIRGLVLRLHRYAQALPDPAGWLRLQLETFANPEPAQWRDWLREALEDWRVPAALALAPVAAANDLAAECARAISAWPPGPSLAAAAETLSAVLAAEKNCPNGKKKHWVKPLAGFFEECRFLASLLPGTHTSDPLREDWEWVRLQMTALLNLAGEFAAAFTEAKRELGVLDFQDLEQFALRLLWDLKTNQPTRVAQQWRQQLRFIFVDEYQDINAAQDRIIQSLSRDGADANRFLVGDVKQSIYRFRLANPHIFQRYIEHWRQSEGRVIPLQDNFRSRKGILDFVNSVAGHLMHRELGGIEYDQEARLHYGEREGEKPGESSLPSGTREPENPHPAVELLLRIKGNGSDEEEGAPNGEPAGDLAELEEAAKEARAVGLRLLTLQAAKYPVWDEQQGCARPFEWRDASILLRAPSRKAESYAKEFARLNIPLQVARGGFYETLEIADLLSLLQVLDNPLQDLPLLALLRSPLVGLTLDELAQIRMAARHTSFWTALVRWKAAQISNFKVPSPKPQVPSIKSEVQLEFKVQSPEPKVEDGAAESLEQKVSLFLERVAHWRGMARQLALSQCLDALLAETHYGEWVAMQPRGAQRSANIKRLLLVAQRFDQLQRQGLFRFLRFVEAQQRAETEPELAAANVENAIRLMSIHQSKGLEFPVVVLADLGKPFNDSDLKAAIILDEQYGLCPQIKPPHTGRRYPSLPHWLAARRQKRELLGEELRLLYVAMTRAKELLILSGSVSQASYDTVWAPDAEALPPALDRARCFADWLGAWYRTHVSANGAREGENELLRWTILDDSALVSMPETGPVSQDAASGTREVDPTIWQALEQRFATAYPFTTSTRLPAKSTVSTLRRQAVAGDAEPEWSAPWVKPKFSSKAPVKAVDIGTAHHRFLQFVNLERTTDEQQLKQEAERLAQQGAFRRDDVPLLDFKAMAGFWNSSLGCRIREHSAWVKRELPFTFRVGAAEVASLVGEPPAAVAPDDFVVVQGIADLAVLLPSEIWLVDFKTDRIGSEEQVAAKGYDQQLKLYARGLAQIFGRPVTEAWLHYLSAGKSVAVALP